MRCFYQTAQFFEKRNTLLLTPDVLLSTNRNHQMNLPKYIVTLLATLLFVLLFFEKSLGLNVAIYGVVTTLLLVVFKTSLFHAFLPKVVGTGFLATSIVYYLFASPFTLFVHILSFLLLVGLHSQPLIRNLLYAFVNAFAIYRAAVADFLNSFRSRKKRKVSLGFGKIVRIVFLPFFVILLFLALYSMGSSFFSDAVGSIGEIVGRFCSKILNYVNIEAVFVALLGLVFAVIHSLQYHASSLSQEDAAKSNILSRVRHKTFRRFRNMDLATEYKSSVFLLVSLNGMLAILLYLEITHVWVGFEWGGELLKELVHEGTYVLLIAILVSMGITLYFFRKNLNFYAKNKALKVLAYIWLGFNALLVVSVGVRTFYYIEFFGLAYKRIGVLFFLVACLIGLGTLMYKVAKTKSIYYVVRVNAFAVYIILLAVCTVNWDSIIARYNFSHYRSSFIHLPFMSNLSDKVLPYLQLTDEQVLTIEAKQVEEIPFAKRGYFKDVDYQNKIATRIRKFKKKQKDRHWLESVWAEDKAYQTLE